MNTLTCNLMTALNNLVATFEQDGWTAPKYMQVQRDTQIKSAKAILSEAEDAIYANMPVGFRRAEIGEYMPCGQTAILHPGETEWVVGPLVGGYECFRSDTKYAVKNTWHDRVRP